MQLTVKSPPVLVLMAQTSTVPPLEAMTA